MKLRTYQRRLNHRIRRAERNGPVRVCIQAPTGSGKGVCIADLLLDPVPQLLLTHRRVLLDQLSGVLTAHGIEHGIRAAGHKRNRSAPIQLAMWQTEWARVFKKPSRWPMHKCVRVHADEVHQFGGPIPRAILNAYHKAGASVIGWTATPSEVGHLVDELFAAATVPELTDAGYLVPFAYYGPTVPDMCRVEKLKRQASGEFSPQEVGKLLRIKALFGHVVDHYGQLNPQRKPTILFAPGVPHSLWFAKSLTRAGIRAAHIDGDRIWLDGAELKSDTANRRLVMEGSRSGDIKVICNRFVLREGWDAPWIEHVILATTFGKRSSFVQAAGRGLRTSPGKERCIFQDHGGNWLLHPSLDDDTPWDMSTAEAVLARQHLDAMRNDEEPEPILCPNCACLRVSGDTCPECGHRYEKQSRIVLHADGTLKRIVGRVWRKRVPRAKTGEDAWTNCFWAARKHRPHFTFGQVKRWAEQMSGEELPFDLPFMPRDADDWKSAIGDVHFARLRAREKKAAW